MKIHFKTEWTPLDFRTAEKAIVKFVNSRYWETLHNPDSTPFYNAKSYNSISDILGLAYTSTSSYAALWACNTELYLDTLHVYHLLGFSVSSYGFVFAIFQDINEKEIIFPIN
jgi:hypothetical protein